MKKIDSLAIAIGSIHELHKRVPNLNLERLAKIKKYVDIPLVLHGASWIP